MAESAPGSACAGLQGGGVVTCRENMQKNLRKKFEVIGNRLLLRNVLFSVDGGKMEQHGFPAQVAEIP